MCLSLLVFYCAFFLVSSEEVLLRTTASPISSASTELCGPQTEIELTKSGDTSTMMVTLSPLERNNICKLRVIAPKTHVINMQFVDEIQQALINDSDSRRPPCVMSIILPENPRIPVWKGDLCSTGPISNPELLTPDFKIMWTAPLNPFLTRHRKFSLTAVGQGQVCKEPGQHTCMRIGWDPMMCVSDSLLCDGFTNCPKSSTTSDEDEKLCKKRFFAPTSLEQLAVELFKKWKPPEFTNNKWLHDKFEQHQSTTSKRPFFWVELNKKPETTTTTTTTRKPVNKAKATDSISQVLSKYGPWGYLMLGMLICGTVLMFCGLWECCFRKPKTEIEPPVSQTQPTTVLIIGNQQEETTNPSPPNYDELDLPPSYTTLFPNFKVNQTPSDRDSEESSAQSTNSDESGIAPNTNRNSDENSAQSTTVESDECSAQSTHSSEEVLEENQSRLEET